MMPWSIFSRHSLRAKNKPGLIGLFIHAVKTGQKLSLTKPGYGWKEWADEAIKRRLSDIRTLMTAISWCISHWAAKNCGVGYGHCHGRRLSALLVGE
ncbi:hypothetical protein [Chlorogloea sp. CCALA 695]|uniref:hypothetical protein n=1 Tax=Chlorogloea sp. CCALA 695 TaxID=2107693 RepID=UPI000D063A6A|nr:hypothetical protein [Chlorogloea sp. CCALA 695]PSB28750.1 hypothetical protein C7B70_20315 [Chlorogloea sp. CCALA 695]